MQDRQAEQLTCPHCSDSYAADATRPPGYCSRTCLRSVITQRQADQQTDWLRARIVQELIRDSWSGRELQERAAPAWRTVHPQPQLVELAALQATAIDE